MPGVRPIRSGFSIVDADDLMDETDRAEAALLARSRLVCCARWQRHRFTYNRHPHTSAPLCIRGTCPARNPRYAPARDPYAHGVLLHAPRKDA